MDSRRMLEQDTAVQIIFLAVKISVKMKGGHMPKRGENIYKRKDGRWEGRIKKTAACSNERKYKYFYGKTYKEVRQKMEEYRKSPSQTEELPAWNMREASEIWLRNGKPEWKPTTYRVYRQAIDKYVIPILGTMKINKINVQILEKFRLQIEEGNASLSHNYQCYICALVRRILFHAKNKYGCEIQVPALSVARNKKNRIELPGDYSLAVLENYLLQNSADDTCLGILIALYTGIRIGELCALMWEDIDLEEQVIHIRKNLQRTMETEGGTNKTKVVLLNPKTANSLRFIPIPPALCGLMKDRKKSTGFIISGVRKEWIDIRTLQYRFKQILRQCGIGYFNFHMLRHAFATRCIAMGVDMKSLSEILGHSSVQITMSLYVHPTIQQKKQQMDKFTPYINTLCFTSYGM